MSGVMEAPYVFRWTSRSGAELETEVRLSAAAVSCYSDAELPRHSARRAFHLARRARRAADEQWRAPEMPRCRAVVAARAKLVPTLIVSLQEGISPVESGI